MATAFGIPRPALSQSTIVIAAIAGAWVLWLAANNKILVYWQILMGAGAATQSGTGGTATGTPSTGSTTQPSINNPFTWNDLPWPFGTGTGAAGSGSTTSINPLYGPGGLTGGL